MIESTGIQCTHIFHVMKMEQLVCIPPTLILGCWTKSAKVSKLMKMPATGLHLDKELSKIVKFGSLLAVCSNLCFFTAKIEQSYTITLDEIQRLTLRVEQMLAGDESATKNCVLQAGLKLKDPIKVNSKSCAKTVKHDGVKNRKCNQCFQPGHTKHSCPLYPSKYVQPNDLDCIVGGISCVSNDIRSRPSTYNVLTQIVRWHQPRQVPQDLHLR